MSEFRQVMFTRLMPNLREIGLLSDRILPDYERVGLLQYARGKAAPELTGEQMIADLDGGLEHLPPHAREGGRGGERAAPPL